MNLDPTLPPVTVAEAALVLNVSTDTIYRAIARGEIRALRLGTVIRLSRQELRRHLQLDEDDLSAATTNGAATLRAVSP